ncbi:hypothetical protein Patl1_24406 [Pistacia atlantica]|uniref:Uncharacterized protein n=1 Tax=Pistacia atlantica TaxID=434234 RepID=A0ACC0ZX29_9ROSI|nr:hypothetical protein Patl1_24406 [Pistacia atlantica]
MNEINSIEITHFVLDAVKFLAAPIGRPFKYLYNYDTNFRNLEKEVRTLKNTSDDVQVKVTDAEVNVEEIKQSVKDWQTTVNNTITEAERVSYPTIPLEKNFDKLRDDVSKLTNARRKVQRKVEEAKNNEEEIEEDVKKWLEDVDSIIVKADDLIKNQSSIGTDRETRYQKSKAASELMEDKIDPLLHQEVKFDRVSHPTIPLEKNFDKLLDDVSKLTNARRKVQRKVEEAKNNEEEIEEDVKKWLEDVDSIIVKADDLIKNQSSIGTDRKTRYQKSKAAFELMEDKIDPLLQQEVKFDRVSYPTIPLEKNFDKLRDDVSKLTNARRKVQRKVEEAKNNVEEIEEDVKKWLEDVDSVIDEAEKLIEDQSSIGTDWLTRYQKSKAASELMEDKIDPLLQQEKSFKEVTETLDVKRIQTEIADKLGVKFNNESERKINCGGCKLLLTTRNLDVLEKMGLIRNFGMNVLNKEEAWNLFQNMAVNLGNVIQTLELNSLPNDVCKECGGLPIVIATVARALRNKRHQFEWEDALRELRAPSPTKFIGCLEKEYQKIALNLFKNIVSFDILEGDNLTMEKARNRLDKVVRELKYSCLLLHGFTDRQFSMHDVIRAIAITIAFTDHHVFKERNDVERVWKDKDKLRKCTRISLHGSSISQLWHKDLDCPDLEFFYMTGMWDSSFEILEDFFIGMPKLKVLNLFNMQQSSLPSSLDLLTNLQTLCLDGSHIESVAIIEKLEKLKVLSLQHSDVENLPPEIEFYVRGCPIQWKVEVIEELKLLSRLACLELDINDSKMLPKDFFSKELKRYKILVGNWPSLYFENNEYEGVRMFKLNFNSTISLEELQGIKNVEILLLAEFSDAENSFNEFITLTPFLNEKV